MAMIAWVEDDAYDIYDLVLPLQAAGHEMFVVTNQLQAQDEIGTLKRCSVLLIDILLPSGDPDKPDFSRDSGLVLLAELRKRGVKSPAVVVSATARSSFEPLDADLDIVDWLQKPVSRAKLAERVTAVLEG